MLREISFLFHLSILSVRVDFSTRSWDLVFKLIVKNIRYHLLCLLADDSVNVNFWEQKAIFFFFQNLIDL